MVRPEVRELVREILKEAAVLPPGVSSALRAARGPALGVAAGAAGMYGLSRAGEAEQRRNQEAEELRQLLEEYPELMVSTPTPFDQQYDEMGGIPEEYKG